MNANLGYHERQLQQVYRSTIFFDEFLCSNVNLRGGV